MSRNHKSYDCFFAKCLTCFDPAEPLHQHVTITIGTNENGRLLADFENALCNLAHDIRDADAMDAAKESAGVVP